MYVSLMAVRYTVESSNHWRNDIYPFKKVSVFNAIQDILGHRQILFIQRMSSVVILETFYCIRHRF